LKVEGKRFGYFTVNDCENDDHIKVSAKQTSGRKIKDAVVGCVLYGKQTQMEARGDSFLFLVPIWGYSY
jgi:hypothetical protein